MNTSKLVATLLVVFSLHLTGNAQRTIRDTVYYQVDETTDPYIKERCRMDIHIPKGSEGKPTVVFIHGGGLNSSEKYISEHIYKYGLITAAMNYRLSPKAKCPAYIEDVAAAVAWVYKNIEKLGGDKSKIYVVGESAGGYLATLIALDTSYLAKHKVNADSIAGYIPISGQMTTHFSVLWEQGIYEGTDTEIINSYAPLNFIRTTKVPLLFIIADRELDMPGRYKQNKRIVDLLRPTNPQIALWELKSTNHSTVTIPALSELSRLISKDSLQYIKDSIFFDSSTHLRELYDSKAVKQVNVYNLNGQPIDKEDGYSRTNQVLIWRSVDTTNKVTTRKILRR